MAANCPDCQGDGRICRGCKKGIFHCECAEHSSGVYSDVCQKCYPPTPAIIDDKPFITGM